MTGLSTFKWISVLSLATAATTVAVVHEGLPTASAQAPAVAAFVPAAEASPQPAARPAPELTARDRDAALALPLPAATTEPPFRATLSDNAPLEAAFAACDHLVPDGTAEGRFEIEVTVEGGVEGAGNRLVGASVTRGRKLPCIDPDATFDEPDGPDVVRFEEVTACVEQTIGADLGDVLPQGERRAYAAVIGEPKAAPVGPPLPPPSGNPVDPEQAIAAFQLVGTAPAARVSVVECGGYDCSFCNKARETIDELQTRYGETLSFHFLQMPLPMHATGALAAKAAVAAAAQGKFWAMHEALFDRPLVRDEAGLVALAREIGLDGDRFAADLVAPATAQAVADQREVCEAAGARGTPSFFIEGDLLVGSQAIEAFAEVIDDELAEG